MYVASVILSEAARYLAQDFAGVGGPSKPTKILADKIGVVPVESEQSHDPQRSHTLQNIIIVIVVGIFLGIGPYMPRQIFVGDGLDWRRIRWLLICFSNL